MKMRKLLFLILAVILVLSCSQKNWTSGPEGVTVYPEYRTENGARAVRIVPLNDEMIRVSASATKAFSKDPSLVVLPDLTPVKYELKENGEALVLSTAELIVEINKGSGDVKFSDKSGNLLLQDKSGSGKRFDPIVVDGVKGYTLRQVFDSSGDEALYGLGQHQAGEINYKGKNEELFQYNTKVSCPFIVSTRNYGVLWDNYSFSRFGDPRPYGPLNQFTLYDKNGEAGGLTATYTDDREKEHLFTVRKEAVIDYENLTTIKNFPQGFNFNKASITWEGEMQPKESGVFNFLLYYAGYTKIWVDGKLYADKWRTAWNPSVAKFGIDMKEGQKYHLKLEWIPDGGVSYIGLKALSPADPSEQKNISFWSEMGDQINYCFIKGKSMDGVIRNFRELTGKAQVMPAWAMGFWQSRERYKTQDELVNTLAEFRKKHIPIDNIVQDWSYWEVDKWGSHEFDKARFPDPEGMVKNVHDQHARIMISVWPKFYITTEHYKEFNDRGWMYRQAVKDSIRDWIWPGYIGSFYDAYCPEARTLFWKQMEEHLYSKGFDAWWMDASEPDILSNASMDYRKQLTGPTALGPSAKYFNTYALMNARGIYEGQRGKNPVDRVFLLTRSGFPGMQRYGAATWSGDIGTCWEDMQSQITAGINFSMSGLPYWTMDIGGFCVQRKFEQAKEGSPEMDEWRELNTRWFQFGAFVPLFRSHGQYPYREMFNLAPGNHPAYQSMLYYDKLRYRLMPYIYSLAGSVYHNGYTIMRAMAMDFPENRETWNIADQYMFGPSIMICPVYRYKSRERDIFFPGTGWFDLYSGSYLKGNQKVTVGAPFERMPVFVREGSIIPVGPEIEYTGQKQEEPVDIYVYTGTDGSFDLYEDEKVNYNYEKGKYSRITFSWSDKDQKLTIHERTGDFDGMVKERIFKIIKVTKDKPVPFLSDKAVSTVVKYDGKEVII
jgi:alpha-D-xyloside xylohydrolase